MRKLIRIGLVLGVALAAPIAAVRAEPRASFVIIVHPTNPTTRVDRKFVEDAFLKKTTRWPDDQVIRPVDLSPSSPIRRQFSEGMLKRPVEAVKGYWQQRIFSGRDVPPPELNNDESVVEYVLEHEGAVGYISTDTDLGGAKVVVVE